MDNKPTEKGEWVSVEDEPMPFEQFIIVAHPYGIEAINWHTGAWRYWYINKPLNETLLRSITHWQKPSPPNK